VINQQRLLVVLVLILEHRNPNPSSSKSKTSHSDVGKSKDIGRDINSEFGSSDSLSLC
jgi:hypothetical protein